MEHNQNAFTPEAATDEPASSANPAPAAGEERPPDLLDFDPVATRRRFDGLTPERQREYVEALADSGVARYAAARIGISEQAINRLRRRADARSFNLACDAAMRLGARRLQSIAWERAIEGTVRRYHYHGKLVAEERVFDNRLLIYLLGKTEHLREPSRECIAVADNWEPFMESLEHGTPPPDLRPAWRREQDERLAAVDEDEPGADELWEEEGVWMTSFPPPADFAGFDYGVPGGEDYSRSLSDAEEEALAIGDEEERAEEILRGCARRDRYFGFAGGLDADVLPEGYEEQEAEHEPEREENSGPMEAETNETSGAGPPTDEAAIAEPRDEEDKEAP